MNIQIFGTKKSSDTRKAERFFKERGIKFQFIDMKEKELSKGEFNSVMQAVGGVDAMIDPNCKDKDLLTFQRMNGLKKCWRIRVLSASRSSGTAVRPLSDMSRIYGRNGNNRTGRDNVSIFSTDKSKYDGRHGNNRTERNPVPQPI